MIDTAPNRTRRTRSGGLQKTATPSIQETTGPQMARERRRRGGSEADLIRRAQAGDQQAFTALIRTHDDSMRGLAWQLLKDRHAMDDALQDAYIKAYRQIGSFRADARFSSWLCRVVHNSCMDYHRRRARQPRVSIDEPGQPTAVSPADHASQLASRDALTAALSTLSPDHAAVVALVDGEGLSYDDVSEMLGVAPGTIASRLNRARATLRQALGQGGMIR